MADQSTIESPILDSDGNPFRTIVLRETPASVKQIRRQMETLKAKYDAAQTHDGNYRHWAQADAVGPNTSASYAVRRTLRMRARYEAHENNPYLKGALMTLAADFIGGGVRLRVTDDRIAESDRDEINSDLEEWILETGLRRKLYQARFMRTVDGELFFRAFTDPMLLDSGFPVAINWQLLEADQVTSEGISLKNYDPSQEYREYDGVRLDKYNRPVQYMILNQHPNETLGINTTSVQGYWEDAAYIAHWKNAMRPSARAVSELAPGLPLCAIARRYTLAVANAAEAASCIAGVVESDSPPATSASFTSPAEDNEFEAFPFEMNMILHLPYRTKFQQVKTTQPVAVYDMYIEALLREIMRPLRIPFNVAVGSSKDSNMASGVLDSHIYRNGVWDDRRTCEEDVLAKMFKLFWAEISITKYSQYANIRRPSYECKWDKIGVEHTDPMKVAKANQIKFMSGQTSLRRFCSAHNYKYEEFVEELRETKAVFEELGLDMTQGYVAEDAEDTEDDEQNSGQEED